jgi:hypothetical protein
MTPVSCLLITLDTHLCLGLRVSVILRKVLQTPLLTDESETISLTLYHSSTILVRKMFGYV